MIQIPSVYEFGQIEIVSPGVPNQEHMVFRPVDNTNLGHFGIILGRKTPENTFTLLWDHFFWFGDKAITAPSWVIVFTSQGVQSDLPMPDTKQPVYFFYWGKKHTLFHVPDIHPILIRIGGVIIAQRPS